MELLRQYDRAGYQSAQAAMRASGLASVIVTDHARWNRRPHRAVFFEERARSGPPGDISSRGGTYQTGIFGEEIVADGLVRSGWNILGHRVRTKVGEIDLIARRGTTMVFAEVKTAGPGRLAVEQAIDSRSRGRIRRAAVTWMAMNPRLQRGIKRYRFDVFLVHRDGDGGVTRIDHVRDAF
jgi:putative endonuclease